MSNIQKSNTGAISCADFVQEMVDHDGSRTKIFTEILDHHMYKNTDWYTYFIVCALSNQTIKIFKCFDTFRDYCRSIDITQVNSVHLVTDRDYHVTLFDIWKDNESHREQDTEKLKNELQRLSLDFWAHHDAIFVISFKDETLRICLTMVELAEYVNDLDPSRLAAVKAIDAKTSRNFHVVLFESNV